MTSSFDQFVEQLLIEDVNARIKTRPQKFSILLELAIKYNNVEAVKCALEHGKTDENFNKVLSENLIVALKLQHTNIVHELLIFPNLIHHMDDDCVACAAKYDNLETIIYFIHHYKPNYVHTIIDIVMKCATNETMINWIFDNISFTFNETQAERFMINCNNRACAIRCFEWMGNKTQKFMQFTFELACKHGNVELYDYLIANINDLRQSLLIASKAGSTIIVDKIMKTGKITYANACLAVDEAGDAEQFDIYPIIRQYLPHVKLVHTFVRLLKHKRTDEAIALYQTLSDEDKKTREVDSIREYMARYAPYVKDTCRRDHSANYWLYDDEYVHTHGRQ